MGKYFVHRLNSNAKFIIKILIIMISLVSIFILLFDTYFSDRSMNAFEAFLIFNFIILIFLFIMSIITKSNIKKIKYSYMLCVFIILFFVTLLFCVIILEESKSTVLDTYLSLFLLLGLVPMTVMLCFKFEENNKDSKNIISDLIQRARSIAFIQKYDFKFRSIVIVIILFITFMISVLVSGMTVTTTRFFLFIYFILQPILLILFGMPTIKKLDISISSINISLKDIKSCKMYACANKSIGESFTILEVNIKHIYPQGSDDKGFYLDNYQNINAEILYDPTKFYFFIPSKYHLSNFEIKLVYFFKTEKEKKINSISLHLDAEEFDSNLIPSIEVFENFISKKDKKSYKKIDRKVTRKKIKCELRNGVQQLYYYKNSLEDRSLHVDLLDKRKFLLHDDSFGVGKSTFDMNYIIYNGYRPIVISPWESNFDHDFLYLIFMKIKKATYTKLHRPKKYLLVFYITMLVSIETIILSNYEQLSLIFRPIFQTFDSLFSKTQKPLIYDLFFKKLLNRETLILIIVPIFIYIVYKCFIDSIIIFKKDYSRVYQEFFIMEIKNMLNKPGKYLLLIEDIDRLSNKSMETLFRTISAINQDMKKSNIVGLLSLSLENLNKQISENSDFDFMDIKNKIVYDKVVVNYDCLESMKLYLDNVLTFILKEKVL